MNESKNDSKRSEPTSRVSPKSFVVASSLFIFFVGVGFGFLFGTTQVSDAERQATDIILDRSEDHTSEAANFELFWDVWDHVSENYVDQPVNEEEMLYGAIDGLLQGVGDPYAAFFDPEESEEFFAEINGNFEGIGAEIGFRNEQLTVIAPLASSPAEAAGLQSGDIILAVNEEDTSAMSLYMAVDKIRGEKGTEVVLTVFRDGVDEPFDVDIVRDTIKIESVKWEMIEAGDKRVAMITLSQFNGDTTAAFDAAVNEIVLEQPDGLIIDVRNNPGGFLNAVIEIAGYFVDDGDVVVWRQGQENVDEAFTASGEPVLGDMETVILMNEGSASASEILAAALEENEEAVLIGETTFGKGTVQDVYDFDDGSTIKFTIARWLTPNKELIEEVGVNPNYFVERTVDDINDDTDPQLNAAKMFFSNNTKFLNTYDVFTEDTNE